MVCFLAITLFAGEYSVGEQKFNFPAPEGFLPTSTNAPELFAHVSALFPSNIRVIEHFLRPEEIEAFKSGKTELFKEWITILVFSDLEGGNHTLQDFADHKNELKEQLKPSLHSFDEIVPELTEALDDDILDFMRKYGQIVTFGLNQDTERYVSYSFLGLYKARKDQKPIRYIAAGTSAQILIRGKIIMINTYKIFQDRRSIGWTRTTSETYIKKIISRNPTGETGK